MPTQPLQALQAAMAAPVALAAEVAMAVPAGARRAWALLVRVVRPVRAAAWEMRVMVDVALTVMRELPMAAAAEMAARVAVAAKVATAVPVVVALPQSPQEWPAEMAAQAAPVAQTSLELRVQVALVARVELDSTAPRARSSLSPELEQAAVTVARVARAERQRQASQVPAVRVESQA